MDERGLKLAEDFVSARYVAAGRESLQATARTLRSILAQRRCPEEGLSDAAIQLILRQLALMDTNNFAAHVGGGEREGRVVSALVRQRHFDFTHGIGRSGDLVSEQPKAAGSSLMYQITNVLLLDLIRLAGAPSTMAAVVVPMATGMTLALVLRCVAKARLREVAEKQQASAETAAPTAAAPTAAAGAAAPPSHVVPRFVIWPRIDQKTALKCIDAAGLTPVPVQLRPAPPLHCSTTASATATAQFLQCEVSDIAAAVDAVGGPAHVVCVLSTTSCFAPRLPDNTVAIAAYCKTHEIPYVVNNAYGVQSRRIMTRLDAAQRLGRVDYVVQSGDKNFLVPVGGSVVCSSSVAKCKAAAELYAGRASASPVMDLFITALSLGRRGMQELWAARYACRQHLVVQLRSFARERGEELLVDDVEDVEGLAEKDSAVPSPPCLPEKGTPAQSGKSRHGASGAGAAAAPPQPRNDISVAVTMRFFGRATSSQEDTRVEGGSEGVDIQQDWAAARALGAQLFRSAVTGPRVILPAPATATTIAGCVFHNYGMHQEGTPAAPMLVIACGIGMTMAEVDALMDRLRKLWPPRAA